MSVPLLLEEDCERGGKDYEEDGIENDFAYRNNVSQATRAIRLGFIRKVYGLLSMQLLITIIVGSLCMFTPPIKEYVQSNGWLMNISFLGSLFLLFGLFVKRKESPANLILLAAFTIVQAYTIGVILTFYSKVVVIQAFVVTFAVVTGLTLYTFQTKRDFSAWYSGLFSGLCVLLVGGFMQLFVQSDAIEFGISLGGALLFSLFIIYDTQMMMNHLSAEEYILATINLYLDIINLFLYILRILGNRQ